MFGFNNFDRPGKGVNKRDPNQPRTSIYFELLGRKLWDLCKVNFLYILLAIPTFIVTMLIVGVATSRFTDAVAPVLTEILDLGSADASNSQLSTYLLGFDLAIRGIFAGLFAIFLGLGPVTAGITYILRNYGREEHAWLWSDTWRNIKSNFKQSILLWIIDLAVFFVLVVALDFYGRTGQAWGTVAFYMILCVSLLYLMMHIYVYQIMITFELPFKNVLKNSFIMALMTAPKTLLMLVILAVIHIGLPVLLITINNSWLLIIFILLEIIFLPAASMFTTNFFIYNTVEKYIKQALEQAENKDTDGSGEEETENPEQ